MDEKKELQTGFAEIEGARIFYEIAGDGPYLVLIHAGITDLRMWDDQYPEFSSHYRVVRYDMRGFGKSPMSPGPFSNRQDLYRLLVFLGIKQSHFIGCSMGGFTLIDFALEHPGMTHSLVLVSAAVSGFQFSGEPPTQILELINARRERDFNRAAELHVQIWADGFRGGSGHADARVRDRVRQMSLVALSNQADYLKQTGFVMEEPLTPPAMERLNQIAVPTLVIAGDLDDNNVIMTANTLVERIPGARKEIISNTAHLPNMEKPGEFNRLALGFLKSLSARRQ
jgi:pimeloyl-ACP methyl ester carboxylesterase